MIEPELAFADMHVAMDNAENYVKHLVTKVVAKHSTDLELFRKHYDKTVFDRLEYPHILTCR